MPSNPGIRVRDGNSVRFPVRVTDLTVPNYNCTFFNTPSPTPAPDTRLAAIVVVKDIDTDGDLESSGDRDLPPSWEFDAAFEDDVEIVAADRDTDRDVPARWLIRHPGGSTRVVVTEVSQNGHWLLAASCIDADDALAREIPTTLDGNSLSFEVSGNNTFSDEPHTFVCDFLNTPVGAALPTLPPTDAATGSAAPGSEAWRLVLVGLAALIAGILVVRPRPAARSRT